MKNIKLIVTSIVLSLLSFNMIHAQSFSYVETPMDSYSNTKALDEDIEEEKMEAVEASSNKMFVALNNVLEVNFSKDSNPNFYFKIIDDNDNLIYSGSLHNLFSLKLNIENFEPGTYYLNVQNEDFFKSKSFVITENIKA